MCRRRTWSRRYNRPPIRRPARAHFSRSTHGQRPPFRTHNKSLQEAGMAYFVTGGTGFIGRFLVAALIERGELVYLLLRDSSRAKFAALRETWGADEEQVIAIAGDLAKPNLGV